MADKLSKNSNWLNLVINGSINFKDMSIYNIAKSTWY